jgi:hypothetical protein
MKTIKISKYSIIVTIVAILCAGWIVRSSIRSAKKYKEIVQLYQVAQDSLTITRNKLGQQVAKTTVLQATNEKYFLKLQTNDVEIKHLQDVVKEEKKKRRDVEVALVVTTNTNIHLKDSIRNLIAGYDTTDSVPTPVYEKEFKNEWVSGKVRLGLKQFELNQVIVNKYEIVVGDEPDGWFKKKPYAQIKNLNPYSSVESMKVYQKTSVPNKGLKTATKYGVGGIIVGFLIKSVFF